ncbi:hypothetical protein FGO68_gene2581 [Halteria grandinella]|uniref:MEMO1 family protein n=1 Tax=Halteria grandinella TaxID=5974 RepID=A0A8J8NLN0_HALGN|nr:hypothetical protein FGO68_gene2581 [Halteria grandinella]
MQGGSSLIRKAEHAGSWYTAEKDILQQQLVDFLKSSQSHKSDGKLLKALIGPHAGYRYSGPTAAWAYANVNAEQVKKTTRIFLLGPSHKVFLEFIATTHCTEWATPLGNWKIDVEVVQKLCSLDGEMFQQIDKKYEENEHSLEMHLPYLRHVFASNPDVKLIPLMVGHLPDETFDKYGAILAPYFLDPESLFVISTDFCHWGKRFKFTHIFKDSGKIHESIEKLDRMGMDLIEKHDFKGFSDYLSTLKNTICGRLPLQVLLSVIKNVQKQGIEVETKFVKYAQSSQIADDMEDSSVSYASAATFVMQ